MVLMAMFMDLYLEQISIGLIVLFPTLEGTDDVSNSWVRLHPDPII